MSKTDFSKVDRLVNSAIATGMKNLGNDIKNRAIILAPKDSGDLRGSAKAEMRDNGQTVDISFNTPYALRRHFENNLHPATKHYLSNAMKSIKNIDNYFTEKF